MQKSADSLRKDALLVAFADCDITRPHLEGLPVRGRLRGHDQSRCARLITVRTNVHVLLLARLICK